MRVDPAIVSLLNLDADNASLSSASGGGMSSASTFTITARLEDGSTARYFAKTGRGKEGEVMFAGEHASLNAIHNVVPTLCPKSYGHGKLEDAKKGMSFVVSDFLDRTSGRSSRKSSSPGMTLAQKLAKLHTTPAPIPEGYETPQFGFPFTTCCGNTPQDNTYSSSWADFYSNRRLRFIMKQSRTSNGADEQLEALIEQTCTAVVPDSSATSI